jgi:Cytochrome P460
MMSKLAVFASAALALSAMPGPVRADGDKVVFPESFAQGVMYASQDLANPKEFREFYITPGALAAARAGEPLPSGTVVTLVRYKVELDAQGNPVKGADGHFVKTGALVAYRVMEKRTGWGSEYPADKRNGEWEYQAFLPDGKVDAGAHLDACFACHKNGDSTNFMFTADKLKAAAQSLGHGG